MSAPLFGGSSLKKITAATLSVNGRGQGEEASARRWCGMAWRGVVPPRCCGRSAHGQLLPVRRKPRYKSRRLPCRPASSKAVNSTWVLSPIWQIVLLDASLPWSCYSLLVLPHAKRVFKSKQLMHLEEDRTGQQAWPSASFHVLVHESILFFSPFPFLNSPAPELKENQNSAVALALPSRHLVQDQRDMESSTARLRSLSPGPPLQRSRFGREDVKEPEEILTPTEKAPPLERGIFAERLKGGLLCSLVLPQRQQTTAHVSCGTPYTQEDTQEVHHYCSPTAKLPLEHLTVKQRRKTQLKMKGANYVP